MFYGPSGVGKTEISKIISECLGGKLLRKQMSMNKTNYMFDYIFGNKHGKSSLAKDLLERESNVILLDEFDKGLSEINSAFTNSLMKVFLRTLIMKLICLIR